MGKEGDLWVREEDAHQIMLTLSGRAVTKESALKTLDRTKELILKSEYLFED